MSNNRPENAVVLIPSLEPDERLPRYVKALLAKGFGHIVVVDDGSSEAFQPIFQQLADMPGVTVTHHEVNRGKGAALKTGYALIEKQFPDCLGVVTADADGQHTVQDVWRLAEALTSGEKKLYLGSRDFPCPMCRLAPAMATALPAACLRRCTVNGCRTRRRVCGPSARESCPLCRRSRATAMNMKCGC